MVAASLASGVVAQSNVSNKEYSLDAVAKESKRSITKVTNSPFTTKTVFMANESFDVFPPTGWTVSSGPASTTAEPDMMWHQETTGNPTSCASVLYVNSVDVLDEWLVTPTIDLTSSSADVRLKFEFNTSQFWHVTPNDNVDINVIVSTDGGVSFTDTIWQEDDLTFLQNSYLDLDWETYVWTAALLDISAYSGMNNLQFAFVYAGQDGAQFNLDNVSIADVEANDLVAVQAFAADITTDYEYSMVPLAQARPLSFGLELQNIGSADQTNVGIDYDVTDAVPTSLEAGSETPVATLVPGAKDTIYKTSAITPTTVGVYALDMEGVADATDFNNTNNSLARTVEYTDYVWAVDDNMFTSGISNVSSQPGEAIEIGNSFLANAASTITHLHIGISDLATNDGQLVYGKIYLFDAGSQAYVFAEQTAEYTVTTADLGAMVSLELSSTYDLVAGGEYLVVACHYGGTDELEFAMSGPASEGSVIGYTSDGSPFTLTSPNAIMVRLQLEDPAASVNEVTENVTVSQNFPNPFNGNTTVNYTLTSTDEVMVEITDVTGKVIEVINEGVRTAGSHAVVINSNKLAAGTYYYTVSTSNGKVTNAMNVTK